MHAVGGGRKKNWKTKGKKAKTEGEKGGTETKKETSRA
jgi:hypothetical protein